MKRLIYISTIILSGFVAFSCMREQDPAPHYLSNRAPLAENAYLELPLGAIKAEGWLLDQLERQKTGLTGHMDSVYALVDGPRNAWLGGDGDCWERGPYWIDGLLPLAYILDDDALKAKAQPWVEWALASQKENGFFGPDTDREPEWGMQRDNSHDWWPRMVVLKILKQYYQATGDERVIPFMTKYFKYQLEQLPNTPIDHWTYWGGGAVPATISALCTGFTTLQEMISFSILENFSTVRVLTGQGYLAVIHMTLP